MTGLLGVIAGVAAVLAVVVTSLFIGVCLAVARIADAVRGHRQRQAPAERNAWSGMPFPAGGRRGNGPGGHAASGRGGR